jgi:hypothetical protein
MGLLLKIEVNHRYVFRSRLIVDLRSTKYRVCLVLFWVYFFKVLAVVAPNLILWCLDYVSGCCSLVVGSLVGI